MPQQYTTNADGIRVISSNPPVKPVDVQSITSQPETNYTTNADGIRVLSSTSPQAPQPHLEGVKPGPTPELVTDIPNITKAGVSGIAEGLGYDPESPILGTAKNIITGIPKTAYNLAKLPFQSATGTGTENPVVQSITQPAKEVKEGYQTGDYPKMAHGLGQLSAPVVGAAAGGVAEESLPEIKTGITKAIYGKGAVTPEGELKPSIELPEPTKPIKNLADALGAKNNLNAESHLQEMSGTAFDDLKNSENKLGRVTDQKRLNLVTDDARNNVWNREIKPFLDRSGPAETSQVAQDIIKQIPQGLLKDETLAKVIQDVNKEYGNRSYTTQELETKLQGARADMNNVLSDNNFNQALSDKTPNGAIARAHYEALKQFLYDHVNNSTARDIRPALQRYGALTDIQQTLGNRPVSPTFLERIEGRYTSPTERGVVGRTIAAAGSVFKGDDALIRKAFGSYVGDTSRIPSTDELTQAYKDADRTQIMRMMKPTKSVEVNPPVGTKTTLATLPDELQVGKPKADLPPALNQKLDNFTNRSELNKAVNDFYERHKPKAPVPTAKPTATPEPELDLTDATPEQKANARFPSSAPGFKMPSPIKAGLSPETLDALDKFYKRNKGQ